MQYIAICGTVGSGKTTLLRRLLARLGERAAFHEERPQDNPYINDYYSDSKRWSFHSQVTFLSLYFDDPKWQTGSAADFFFFDRAFLENLVIAEYRRDQGDLSADEYAVLCKLAGGIAALMPPIDKYPGICQMPIISSCYWNMVHGSCAEDVEQDEEGLRTMRVLGHNMAYFLKCLEAGKTAGVPLPPEEPPARTNFIR